MGNCSGNLAGGNDDFGSDWDDGYGNESDWDGEVSFGSFVRDLAQEQEEIRAEATQVGPQQESIVEKRRALGRMVAKVAKIAKMSVSDVLVEMDRCTTDPSYFPEIPGSKRLKLSLSSDVQELTPERLERAKASVNRARKERLLMKDAFMKAVDDKDLELLEGLVIASIYPNEVTAELGLRKYDLEVSVRSHWYGGPNSLMDYCAKQNWREGVELIHFYGETLSPRTALMMEGTDLFEDLFVGQNQDVVQDYHFIKLIRQKQVGVVARILKQNPKSAFVATRFRPPFTELSSIFLSPILTAIEVEDAAIFQLVFDAIKDDPRQLEQTAGRISPLWLAMKKQKGDYVDQILEVDIELSFRHDSKLELPVSGKYGNSYLHLAADLGDTDLFRRLYKLDAPVTDTLLQFLRDRSSDTSLAHFTEMYDLVEADKFN